MSKHKQQLTEYTVPQGVKATKTALVIPKGMTREKWAELGQFLRSSEDSLAIWQADWLCYGYSNYEDDYCTSVVDQLQFKLHGVEKLELIGQVQPQHRHETLTPEHYLVAGKRLDDEKEREVWLNTAAIEGLSPRELQASIRAHEVVRIEMDKRSVSMPSPYAVQSEFRAWRKEIGDAWKRWGRQDLEDVADTLREIAAFVGELEAKIKVQQRAA